MAEITVKMIIDIGVLCVTTFMMLAVGMDLKVRHFREMARGKRKLILMLASQAVLLPMLGLALTRMMALPPHLSAGILLLAACPVGDIANFYTLLARTNVALSVTLNTLSCLLSVITMAAIFPVYDYLLGGRFAFAVPTPELTLRLTLIVVLPVLTGMAARRFIPEFVARSAKAVRDVSLAGIVLLLVFVMITQRDRLAADWQLTTVAGAVFMAVAMATGLMFGRVLRLKADDSMTAGIIFAVRNVGLASAIAITLLNRVEYAVFAVVYFLTEVPILLAAVAAYRQWWATAPQPVQSDGGMNVNL
jgi:bile acid:Na+ symporter, BASS family